MRRLLTLSTVALAISAAPLAAQTSWTAEFSLRSPTVQYAWGGYGVGAYAGMLTYGAGVNGPQPSTGGFDFWCVDAAGVYGAGTVTVRRISSVSDATTQSALAQAAYLTTLRSTATSNGAMSNLHAAIWQVTGGISGSTRPSTSWTPQNTTARDQLVAEAQANASRMNLDNFYYVEFTTPGRQEQIFQGAGDPFQVPEPASMTLLATGLVGLAVARRGRRRR